MVFQYANTCLGQSGGFPPIVPSAPEVLISTLAGKQQHKTYLQGGLFFAMNSLSQGKARSPETAVLPTATRVHRISR